MTCRANDPENPVLPSVTMFQKFRRADRVAPHMLRSGKPFSRSKRPRRSMTFHRPCGRMSQRS